jgi:hypothetical protein
LQGLHEIFLSPLVFSFLLAFSPFFSTPYEGASHGNSSNKKMTKGIRTKRVRGSTSRAGQQGRHGRLISDGLTSPPHWAADGEEEDSQQRFFPKQEQVKGWRSTGAGEETAGKK